MEKWRENWRFYNNKQFKHILKQNNINAIYDIIKSHGMWSEQVKKVENIERQN